MINHFKMLTPCEAYFLPWSCITDVLTDQIQKILGRTILSQARPMDHDYWGVRAKGTKFTLEELHCLLDWASATPEEYEETLPVEGETETHDIGMNLCRKLFWLASKSEWQCEGVTEEGLWLVGVSNDGIYPYSRSGLLRQLNQEKLMSMKDALASLEEFGNTDRALSYIRRQYSKAFNNELCWQYPISDGVHMGTFILVVKEGYLSIPYDSADEEEYEILVPVDAKLHDIDSLSTFLSNWKSFSDDLTDAMREMRLVLEGGAHVETSKIKTT